MFANVTIYALCPIKITAAEGTTEKEVLENALLEAEKTLRHVTDGSLEVARYEIENTTDPDKPLTIFWDMDHHVVFMEDFIYNNARLFDLPFANQPVIPIDDRRPYVESRT